MAWQDAVQELPSGCRLLLDVAPGAGRTAFPTGHDPWRGRLKVQVRAPAKGGQANAGLLRALGEFFGRPVVLAAGAKGRRKSVDVPLARGEALDLLQRGPWG